MKAFANYAMEIFNLKKPDVPKMPGAKTITGLPCKLGPDFNYDGRAFSACPWAHDRETLAGEPDCDGYR